MISFKSSESSVTTSNWISAAIPAKEAKGLSFQVGIADATAAATATPFGDVDTTNEWFNEVGHGFYTGLKIALTTDDTLPGGLSAADYYLYVEDDDNFGFADTLAEAIAGTIINITSQGAGNHTVTPYAVTAAPPMSVLGSVDGTNYYPVYMNGTAAGVTMNVSTLPGILYSHNEISCSSYKVKVAITTGALTVSLAVAGLEND